MAVLKHEYLEAHDNGANKHAFYLLLLIQEGTTYKTLGYYGRMGASGNVASKYVGSNRAAAEAEFSKVSWDKQHKRGGEVSYAPATLPNQWQTEINRLNAQAPVAPAAPAPVAAKPAPKAAPAAPAAPFPLPEAITPRVDAAAYAKALADPFFGATVSGGEFVFVYIPAGKKAQLVDRAKFPGSGSLNRYPALVASLDPANPVMADSIFAGEVMGKGNALRLWDIVSYRGYDVRAMSLSDRLALLHQAVNELAREGQLSLAWSIAECAVGADKAALASKGGPIVLRSLASAYDPGDGNAAVRRP